MNVKLIGTVLVAWLTVVQAATAAGQKAYPFFPFCIDWHDAKNRSYKEQAEMLKELGYDGVGHILLDGVAERLKTLDEAGLTLYQITMSVDVAPGKPPYDARFKDVLKLVKGRNVQFALLVNGMKPSDPSVDPRAVKILREMSDLARDSGSQLLLYPHVRLVDRADRGLGARGREGRPPQRRRDVQSLPLAARGQAARLQAPAEAGNAAAVGRLHQRRRAQDDKPGWDHYIQPLDRGSFDVGAC